MLSNKNTKNVNFLFIVDILKDLPCAGVDHRKGICQGEKILYEAYRRRYRISPLKIVHKANSVQSALAGGHRCAAQRPDCAPSGHRGDGSRQPLSHPLGCGFGSNENGEVLRCPFQNGVGRNLVIQDHCTPALWVTLRADERAELQVIDNNSASFKKLKLVERASNYLIA